MSRLPDVRDGAMMKEGRSIEGFCYGRVPPPWEVVP
jgi:hypothetical protein